MTPPVPGPTCDLRRKLMMCPERPEPTVNSGSDTPVLELESELVEFDGEDDHVHLLVNYPPKVSVSALVNSLKGVSSRMIRQKNYPNIRKKLWGAALWSPSYFAGSCGGAPIAVIRQYIEQQQTPH